MSIFPIRSKFKLAVGAVAIPAHWAWQQARNRFKNAGVTYNTGNWLAVCGAVAQVALTAHSGVEIASGLRDYFAGTLPAIAATLGTIAFFYGGRRYDHAWEHGFPPNDAQNREGHLWSAVGATLITLGLSGLSTTDSAVAAAIVGGALHAGVKSIAYSIRHATNNTSAYHC
jgi:hypothetical protein